MRKDRIADALIKLEQKMDNRFDRVDVRLESLEDGFDNFKGEFSGLKSDFNVFNDLDEKYISLDCKLNEFRTETLDRFDFLFNKIDLFNTEYYAITAGMRRIEDELSKKKI